MGNTIRFTGLSSGLDTESVVKAIMTPYQTKIDTIKQNTTLAEWRKDAYKEMSLKIKNFRDNAVSKLKYASTLNQSKVTMSQEGAIKVDTSKYTTDATHRVHVKSLAEQANVKVSTIRDNNNQKLTADSKISEIKGMPTSGDITLNGKTFTFNENTKISELTSALNSEEVSVKFDESVGAFLINTVKTGSEQKIELSSSDPSILTAMGVKDLVNGNYTSEGKNAIIVYNDGLEFESQSNYIEVNGLSFTAQATTSQAVTINITKDIDSMVNTIKDFVTEYNSLLEEIDTRLNADSASGYKPLTDEEKEAMTDKEIELWESKIKKSLMRKDDSLKNINSVLRGIMSTDYSKKYSDDSKDNTVSDASCSMLFHIGINSTGWKDKGKLTVDEEKLRTALTENGDGVVDLLTTITNRIDRELTKLSSSTETRSYGQYFGDKIQTNNIATYKKNLITAQERYDKLENMYYKKFTAMEKAMSKMNSQSSLFSSL